MIEESKELIEKELFELIQIMDKNYPRLDYDYKTWNKDIIRMASCILRFNPSRFKFSDEILRMIKND